MVMVVRLVALIALFIRTTAPSTLFQPGISYLLPHQTILEYHFHPSIQMTALYQRLAQAQYSLYPYFHLHPHPLPPPLPSPMLLRLHYPFYLLTILLRAYICCIWIYTTNTKCKWDKGWLQFNSNFSHVYWRSGDDESEDLVACYRGWIFCMDSTFVEILGSDFILRMQKRSAYSTSLETVISSIIRL